MLRSNIGRSPATRVTCSVKAATLVRGSILETRAEFAGQGIQGLARLNLLRRQISKPNAVPVFQGIVLGLDETGETVEGLLQIP